MKPQPHTGTMSGLLETAIADARRLGRDLYDPHCRNGHLPNSQGFGEICRAASFPAGTLGCSSTVRTAPWDFPGKTQAKHEARNAMRTGSWLEACRLVCQHRPPVEIEARLCRLPTPSWAAFVGWRAFNSHLKSLEAILPELRGIESDDEQFHALKG